MGNTTQRPQGRAWTHACQRMQHATRGSPQRTLALPCVDSYGRSHLTPNYVSPLQLERAWFDAQRRG